MAATARTFHNRDRTPAGRAGTSACPLSGEPDQDCVEGCPERQVMASLSYRVAIWSLGSGMTALIYRARRSERWAREEQALSPITASGRVRARTVPERVRARTVSGRVLARTVPGRGTLMASRTRGTIRESEPWQGPMVNARGLPFHSQARWIVVLSPPRDRPTARQNRSSHFVASLGHAPKENHSTMDEDARHGLCMGR